MIGERLKTLRQGKGLSQKELATAIRSSQGYISAIERGEKTPGGEILVALRSFLGVDLNWLLDSDGETRPANPPGEDSQVVLPTKKKPDRMVEDGPDADDEYIRIPRFEIAASAGGGAVIHSEQVVDYLSFRADWVRNALGVSVQNLALISVIGDSMEPNLSDGDVVLLDMTTRSVLDGSIYALQLNGGLLIKRIQRKLDGSVVVKSDNPRYEQEVVSEEMAEQLRIVGRVIWVGRRL